MTGIQLINVYPETSAFVVVEDDDQDEVRDQQTLSNPFE